jgi:PAS domain S-box-containing protein
MPGAFTDKEDCGMPWDEAARSAALRSYGMLDTPREHDFDELARVASEICGTPIAIVNLVDTDRQFFKAEVGIGVRSTPLEAAFCRHALLSEDVMIIPDATRDARFDCNPLVTESPYIRAYAGALLKTSEGLPIGTVCVLDYRVHEFTEQQIGMLRFLARQAMAQLELRRTVAQQRRLLVRAVNAEREKANFERVVRQASDFIGMADTKGNVHFLNDAARRLVGLKIAQDVPQNVLEYVAAVDRDVFRNEVMPLVRSGQNCDRELRLRNFTTGADFPARYTIFPLRDDVGSILGYGVVTKDITEQKEEEFKRTQIMGEAAHRIKNTLSVVQAIVTQSLRSNTSVEHSREAITKRVAALARAQDILVAAQGSVTDIVAVVESALAPHDAGDGRLRFNGPSHHLSSPQALGLSLALHELATNAAKYGALSGEEGTVNIDWKVAPDGKFTLKWTEVGGPPVSVPTSTGFGSKLIQRMVGPYFNGKVDLDFLPEGVRFTLQGELPQSK